MVGGKEGEGAIEDALTESRDVAPIAERRVHAPIGVVSGDVFGGEGEVVRGGFSGDGEPLGLRLADKVDAFATGEMLDVQGATGLPTASNIVADGLDFGFGGEDGEVELAGGGAIAHHATVLDVGADGVIHDDAPESLRAEHDFTHDLGGGNHVAIVGKATGTGLGEGFEVGRLVPGAFGGATGGSVEGDIRIGGGGAPDEVGGVGCRGGVGHGDGAGEATESGGAGAGSEVFGGGVAGIAEVDMDVAGSGHDDEVVAVKDGEVRGGVEGERGGRGDAPRGVDKEGGKGVAPGGGVEEAGAGNEEGLSVVHGGIISKRECVIMALWELYNDWSFFW